MTENNDNFDRIMAMQQALMAQEISMRDSLGINRERLGDRSIELQTGAEGMRVFAEAIIQDYQSRVSDPWDSLMESRLRYMVGIDPYHEKSIQDDDQIIF